MISDVYNICAVLGVASPSPVRNVVISVVQCQGRGKGGGPQRTELIDRCFVPNHGQDRLLHLM